MKMRCLVLLTVILGGLLLSALLYVAALVRPGRKSSVDESLLCDYAHRGLHDADVPENSMAAFSRACEAGVGIELDVRLSRDGRVMVFHDVTLLRMTGEEGKLCEWDAADLQGLSLCGSDQTIPTLSEVLRLVDGRVPLLVELKGEGSGTALCEAVGALLEDYEGPYCLESFNPFLVRGIHRRLPEAFCGLLYTNLCRDKKSLSPVYLAGTAMLCNGIAKPHFIAYNQRDRNALPVRLAAGLYRIPRFVWTVRTQAELAEARERGEHPVYEDLSQ